MNTMSEEIELFQKILAEFVNTPKAKANPTFMDICQLGADRFEERCSQILKFYFTPSAPHNMNGLLLDSLLEVIGHEDLSYSNRTTRVITEEMTEEGKFIDITIIADDFVIAIENKIGASLYNPLGSYVNHINKKFYDRDERLFIVLSVRKITDIAELHKMKLHGYIYVNYADLFAVLKRKIGEYAIEADPTYLTFLFDFIKTIDNRYYNSINMELNRFFYNNRKDINWLIAEYNKFEANIKQQRKDRIALLRTRISDCTNANWWVYQGLDLGITFNDEGNKLGIESSFHNGTIDNPVGDFHIYITVWNKKHFMPYEADLKSAYPAYNIDYNYLGYRVNLELPAINGDDDQAIIEALNSCYKVVKQIADKHK
jgi:hypothetical protein